MFHHLKAIEMNPRYVFINFIFGVKVNTVPEPLRRGS